jgi:hypothetical protein
MRFTEEQLARWASSPSQAERDRMANAERAVKTAISANETLCSHNVRVFVQGSYRNRVNVRADSDVDIAVVCGDTFYWEGPAGTTKDSFGIVPATYDFDDFRDDVAGALVDYFGSGAVSPGDKAFDIKANTYRVEADVAAFFDHRRYDGSGNFEPGIEMQTRSGSSIINWPDQHYNNGVAKNDRTGRAYKGCVRILKTLRYAMISDNIQSARDATSFLMECLMWNVPDDDVMWPTWESSMRASLAHLFNNTLSYDKCSEWGEVSELKYLFRGPNPWTWQSAHRFISDCWDYLGFE